MRLIDADEIYKAKFHGVAEIYPSNVATESYKRGWNDALDAIADPSCTPTIEAETVRRGTWINHRNDDGHNIADCSECGEALQWYDDDAVPRYCPMCGARLVMDE